MRDKSLFFKYGVASFVLCLGILFSYQNCSPVKFSDVVTNAPFGTAGSTGPGTNQCAPSVSVTPQLSFVPSSFDAGQPFSIIIANQNLYGSITIDFGDKTPVLVVNPSSSAANTHTYAAQGSYIITVTATDSNCNVALNGSQGVAVSPCVPTAATVETSLTPLLPVPAPVGSFTTQADITNSNDFTSANWTLNGATQSGGSDITLNLAPGSYTLQAQALDTCGTSRPGPPAPICVASSGNPVTSVNPATFTAGTSNVFTVANPGNYGSLNIDFGDGNSSVITTTGAGAGTVSHTYSKFGNFTYTVTATDSCGGGRSTSTPITVAAESCVASQPDGCSGNVYCTGRTNCNPQGICSNSCNLCGYNGLPVSPSTSCTGSQQCVTGGTSCNPTTTCTNVCGQCGFSGTPVIPVTTCSNGKQCVTGGTSCAPTNNCVAIPGQCGDPLPTPIPTPIPIPTPTPPIVSCNFTCSTQAQSCQGSSGSACTLVTTVAPHCSLTDTSGTSFGGLCSCCGNAGLTCKSTTACTSK